MGSLRIAGIAVVTSASLLACGGGAQVQSSGMALGSAPMGTFEGSATGAGKLLRLVLMTDGTSHLEELMVCPLGELGCDPLQIDSFYTLTGNGDSGHLDFRTAAGDLLRAYDYQYDGVTLDILREGDPEPQSLTKPHIGWCSEASQCALQWLPTPLCSGAWTCADNGCYFKCGRGF